MVQTNEFMLVFRLEPSNNQPTEQELNEMHQQWGAFIGKIAIQEKLVSTHQLSFEGKQIAANKKVTEGIHASEGQTIAGNMIIKASTISEATAIAKDCPILLMGGSVEVRGIQPM